MVSVLLHYLPKMTVPPKVFVCHASEDAGHAAAIADRLLSDGYSVWIDSACIRPGEEWESAIRAGVDTADAVLVIVSANSVSKTGTVQREVRLAVDRAQLRAPGSVFVVPVLLDGASPPPSMRHLQWVRHGSNDWYGRLDGSLRGTTRKVLPAFKGARPVELREVRVSAAGGEGLTLDYVVDAGPKGTVVTLGASVVLPDGREIYSVGDDREVGLRPGVAVYRRLLAAREAAETLGARLTFAVWAPRVGGDLLDRYERVGGPLP